MRASALPWVNAQEKGLAETAENDVQGVKQSQTAAIQAAREAIPPTIAHMKQDPKLQITGGNS